MLNMNNEEALAVIFANSYDALIPEMVSERLMASIPFAGRYRLCDFLISSMVHSGIDNISLIVKKNYHSLMDHLGSGQEFDLARKNGGINIVPPYAQKQIKVYEGRVEAIESLKGYLRKCTQKYVIMADANYVFNFDFRELIEAHKNTGADITAMYRKQEVPKVFLRPNGNNDEMYYTFDIDDGRIKKIYINDRDMGKVNFGMNIYIMEKEKLIRIVDDAFVHGYSYFTRDLMATNKKNYHSLMDHLGSGQEFDLARKNGGINIVPPYAQKQIKVYEGRVEAIESLKGYLRKCTQKYVIMADANYVFNFDFRELIEAHKNTGADITAMYRKQEVPKVFLRPNGNNDEMYYTFDIDDGRIKKIYINDRDMGKVNFGMNIYIMEKEKLIRIVDDAFVHGYSYFTRDLMATNTDSLNIQAYEYTGYASQITDMKSYFEENMKLLDEDNRAALFKSGNSIYTKIRDDNPTRYINGSKAKNVMVADGCVIEGTVENSILSRGVKIGKNAKVKNCILLQDTVIEDGANLEYVITDKNVRVSRNRSLTGNDSFQVYVAKGQTV